MQMLHVCPETNGGVPFSLAAAIENEGIDHGHFHAMQDDVEVPPGLANDGGTVGADEPVEMVHSAHVLIVVTDRLRDDLRREDDVPFPVRAFLGFEFLPLLDFHLCVVMVVRKDYTQVFRHPASDHHSVCVCVVTLV